MNIRLVFSVVLSILCLQLFSLQNSYASTLSGAKDTITTSRPSASAPLYTNQASNDTSVTILDNNSSFLASDSAIIFPDTGETINAGIRVSSMSAAMQSPLPVGYWKFDENTGTSVGDSVAGNTGTWNGTLGSQWTTGQINSGGNFPASPYVNIPDSTSYAFSNSMSISLWFNCNTYTNGSLINRRTSGNLGGFTVEHSGSASTLIFYLYIGGSYKSVSTSGWPSATWVHLAATYDGAVMRVYRNGVLVGTTSQIGPINNPSGVSVQIGRNQVNSAVFNGQIDEVGLWSTSLSSSEVTSLYNSGAGIQYPNFLTNTRTVYFASAISNAHHQGDAVIAPITAKHTVQFTPITGVASTGKIVVSFPGIGSNSASPSANTFAFNNLQSSNISTTGASCGSYTLSPPNITCNLNTALSPGTPVTITIGSTTPALINPTKSNTAGTADSWRMTLQTTDASGVILDDAKIAIATIESIKVYGDVDPSITFTITGVNNGVALSTQASGCADSTQNAQSTTPTEVNLGFLRNGQINMAAQLLSVSTNGAQGYVISATSSGKLQNPTTGWGIYGMNGDIGMTANDTPVPATFRASGLEGFGISACGPRTNVNSSQWGASSCTTAFSSGCKYANPWNTGTNSFYSTLASYSGGPVSNDLTVVKYAATASGTTPPGNYRTVFTYVATATF